MLKISFASTSFVIKDNIIKVNISLESLLNLQFCYLISTSVRNQLKSFNNFDVILSASIYFKSTFLYFTAQSSNFASRQFKD